MHTGLTSSMRAGCARPAHSHWQHCRAACGHCARRECRVCRAHHQLVRFQADEVLVEPKACHLIQCLPRYSPKSALGITHLVRAAALH